MTREVSETLERWTLNNTPFVR